MTTPTTKEQFMSRLDDAKLRLAPDTYDVLRSVYDTADPVSALQVSQLTGQQGQRATNTLLRLTRLGYIDKVARGLYTWKGEK